MDSYKWDAVTPHDATLFHSVPMAPGNGAVREPDNNPVVDFDWRNGSKVNREMIPSIINGQTEMSTKSLKFTTFMKIGTINS